MDRSNDHYKKIKHALAKGWNTWNTFSMTSYVLLPEGFALNLGLKSYAQKVFLENIQLNQQPLHGEIVTPGPHSYSGDYTQVGVKIGNTDISIQTAADGEDYVIYVEPISSNIKPCLLVLQAGIMWNRPGFANRKDDFIELSSSEKTIKIYTTASDCEDTYLNLMNPFFGVSIDKPVGFSTGKPRTIEQIKGVIEAKKDQWQKNKKNYCPDDDVYDAIQSSLAWNTIYDPVNKRVISPPHRDWNTQRGGYGLYCWDGYFAGLLAGLDNKSLAYANVVEITREKTEKGFVPNVCFATGRKSRDRSQPPIGSAIVKMLFEKYREKWFIEILIEDLLRWNQWWYDNRREGELLCWGSNKFAPVIGDALEYKQPATLEGAALESGLDNSPMYESTSFDKKTELMKLHDVGLNSLYIFDCNALSYLCRQIGKDEKACELAEKAEKLKLAIQGLWNEEKEIFMNFKTDTKEFSDRISPTCFYPMIDQICTRLQAEKMVERYLCNDQHFWGEWVLPSCSRQDPAYSDQIYWRGRIWPPLNFLVYIGLKNSGLDNHAKELAEKSKDLLLGEWLSKRHVHENYNADTGIGCDSDSSYPLYHWGGLLGLPSLMEKILEIY